MSDPVRWTGQMPQPTNGRPPAGQGSSDGTNLADILERVLDKGIVIAGDVQINLLDIELLTIKLRLVVASVDRAKEMGIDWWERDPTLSSGHQELTAENDRLRARIEQLESGQLADEIEDDEDDDVGELEEGELEDEPVDESRDEFPDDADDDADDASEPEPVRRRPRRSRA